MKGRILDYSFQEFRGLIAGQDGRRYDFVRIDWRGRGEPVAGMEVEFQTDNGKARDITEIAAQPPPPPQYGQPYVPPQPISVYGQPQQPAYAPPQPPAYGQPQPPPYGQPQQPTFGQQPPIFGQPQPAYIPPYAPPPQPYAVPGSVPQMDFPQSIRACFEKYVTFSGRARRAEMWWFFLFLCIVRAVTSVLDRAMANVNHGTGPISGLSTLALLLPWIAVQTRRMHDLNRSGFWVLGFYLAYVPIFVVMFTAIGASTTEAGGDPTAAEMVAAGLATLAFLAVFVWWVVMCAQRGTNGTNQYGPDPLHPPADVF